MKNIDRRRSASDSSNNHEVIVIFINEEVIVPWNTRVFLCLSKLLHIIRSTAAAYISFSLDDTVSKSPWNEHPN